MVKQWQFDSKPAKVIGQLLSPGQDNLANKHLNKLNPHPLISFPFSVVSLTSYQFGLRCISTVPKFFST